MDADSLNLLRRLGLNQYESRVYLALLSSGPVSASKISDLASVPRPRTYDVLAKLEKKGFVAVQPGRPTKFNVIKIEEAFETLKEKRKEELEKELIEVEKIKEKISEKIKMKKPLEIEEGDFVWVLKDSKSIKSKIEKLIQNASISIIIATTEKGLKKKLEAYEHLLREAQKRGVNVKIVTPTKNEDLIRKASKFASIIKRNNLHRMIIADDHVLLFLSPETNEKETGAWIKSSYFANNMKNLF